MASFISTLSLFLLVLANGYFTLPLINEQLQSSTMLPSNVDVTSERPFIPRALLINQVQQTTGSPMELQMTTAMDSSAESDVLKEMTTLSPLMLTTDQLKADKRALKELSLTTVESTTEDDSDNDANNEDNDTAEDESKTKNDKRAVSLELTTNTLPVASSVTSEPSKKYTGLLKDKKDGEQDLEKEKEKEKDDEDKKPVKSNKADKKEKEDDKVPSDEDSKKSAAPTALLDSEGLKNVSNYPKEYMDLDENSTLIVTLSGTTESTATLKDKKGKKPLNQGEESSTAKEEESNN